MQKKSDNTYRLLVIALLLLSFTMAPSFAEDDDDDSDRGRGSSMSHERGGDRDRDGKRENGKGSMSSEVNAKWKEECGSCHLAYPPRLLSRESWRAVMSGLDDHFGSNASLEPLVASEIGLFLDQNASSKSRPAVNGKEPALRISDTRWFHSEHREVSDREWKNPKVKSPSNCGACHTRADSGSYNEHDIKMPR